MVEDPGARAGLAFGCFAMKSRNVIRITDKITDMCMMLDGA